MQVQVKEYDDPLLDLVGVAQPKVFRAGEAEDAKEENLQAFEIGYHPDLGFHVIFSDHKTGYERKVFGLEFADLFKMFGHYVRKWEEEKRGMVTK